ncbi:MAG: glycosyltransferase family 9 protein [Bacteroidales bacterium]|nr:glycosyltransferase family 9 protein [Bacteroidales bacterium]
MPEPILLVIRLSAMGDVALSLPVIIEAAKERRIVIVTKPSFAPFFSNIPGLEIIRVETGGRHKGIIGIVKLYRDIKTSYNVSGVVDLHDVIRSGLLSFLFRLSGVKISRIKKGRVDKRKFIRKKPIGKLPHTTERYKMAFEEAGVKTGDISTPAFFLTDKENRDAVQFVAGVTGNSGELRIAIAPFARHKTKLWPAEYIPELIRLLNRDFSARFFLFGGGDELSRLEMIATVSDNITIIAGRFDLRQEVAILSLMDVMISMDSSNMHLAALAGIKTVSIWGGTHPDTGFAPVGRQQHLIIGVPSEELECRPCTVYGKGKCKRKNVKYKCLKDISPSFVYRRIKEEGLLR